MGFRIAVLEDEEEHARDLVHELSAACPGAEIWWISSITEPGPSSWLCLAGAPETTSPRLEALVDADVVIVDVGMKCRVADWGAPGVDPSAFGGAAFLLEMAERRWGSRRAPAGARVVPRWQFACVWTGQYYHAQHPEGVDSLTRRYPVFKFRKGDPAAHTQLVSMLGAYAAQAARGYPQLINVKEIERSAHSNAPVLIVGEPGTGKEAIAETLAERWQSVSLGALLGTSELYSINCAGITPTLAQSELFGCVAGAHNMAQDHHLGMLMRAAGLLTPSEANVAVPPRARGQTSEAHFATWLRAANRARVCRDHGQDGGVLCFLLPPQRRAMLLDEFGDLPPEVQALLLRYLEAAELRPVGFGGVVRFHRADAGTNPLPVRVFAATSDPRVARMADHPDVQSQPREHRPVPREDLIDRVKDTTIRAEPLRTVEDVREFAERVVAARAEEGVEWDRAAIEWLATRAVVGSGTEHGALVPGQRRRIARIIQSASDHVRTARKRGEIPEREHTVTVGVLEAMRPFADVTSATRSDGPSPIPATASPIVPPARQARIGQARTSTWPELLSALRDGTSAPEVRAQLHGALRDLTSAYGAMIMRVLENAFAATDRDFTKAIRLVLGDPEPTTSAGAKRKSDTTDRKRAWWRWVELFPNRPEAGSRLEWACLKFPPLEGKRAKQTLPSWWPPEWPLGKMKDNPP